MAKLKVVKFCTRVGNINSMQQSDISPTKGRGYGHMAVLKFCRCDAARRASRAGLSATAELLVIIDQLLSKYLFCLARNWLCKTNI